MKVLLIYLGTTAKVYSEAKVRFGVPSTPSLSLATIAAPVLEKGHEVKIVDLSTFKNPYSRLISTLEGFRPDYVGLTFATALFFEAKKVVGMIRDVDKSITIIVGGPHATALPAQTIEDLGCDVLAYGEGDFTLRDIIECDKLSDVSGIAFRDFNKRIIINPPRPIVKDLDSLPFPALHLYDAKKYRTSKVMSRRNPTVALETSRGCVFECCYCNKNIFERRFRAKSPARVVEELNHVLDLGFREVQFMDDGFSTDLDRAKNICRGILDAGLDIPWNLQNGIRCDRVDEEFLRLAYDAGCHRTSFGVETGDAHVMKLIGKGTTLDHIRKGFRLAHQAGIRTTGFFLFGLPGETEKTMQKTIDFAKELDPDVGKVSIMTPYPGTAVYDEWDKRGYITSKNWGDYNQQDPSRIYNHPNLSWDVIFEYQNKFYREMYLNVHYAVKRLKTGFFRGEPFYHLYYGLNMKW